MSMQVVAIRGHFDDLHATFVCEGSEEHIEHCERGFIAWIKHILGWNIYVEVSIEGLRDRVYVPVDQARRTARTDTNIGRAFARILHAHIEEAAVAQRRMEEAFAEYRKALSQDVFTDIPEEYRNEPIFILSREEALQTATPSQIKQHALGKYQQALLRDIRTAIPKGYNGDSDFIEVQHRLQVRFQTLAAFRYALNSNLDAVIPPGYQDDPEFIRAQHDARKIAQTLAATREKQRELAIYQQNLTTNPQTRIPDTYKDDPDFIVAMGIFQKAVQDTAQFLLDLKYIYAQRNTLHMAALAKQRAIGIYRADLTVNANTAIPEGYQDDPDFIVAQRSAQSWVREFSAFSDALKEDANVAIPAPYQENPTFVQIQRSAQQKAATGAKRQAFSFYQQSLAKDVHTSIPQEYRADPEFTLVQRIFQETFQGEDTPLTSSLLDRAKKMVQEALKARREALAIFRRNLNATAFVAIPKAYQNDVDFVTAQGDAQAWSRAYADFSQALRSDVHATIPEPYRFDPTFLFIQQNAEKAAATQAKQQALSAYQQTLLSNVLAPIPDQYREDSDFLHAHCFFQERFHDAAHNLADPTFTRVQRQVQAAAQAKRRSLLTYQQSLGKNATTAPPEEYRKDPDFLQLQRDAQT